MNQLLLFIVSLLTLNIQAKSINNLDYLKQDMYSSIDWIQELNSIGYNAVIPLTKIACPDFVLPLVKCYPALAKIPHASFFNNATPVKQLNNLETLYPNTSLWLKTEDVSAITGFYSGNKRRKLEFELGQAIAQQAKTVITFGYAGSFHAVATSEYAKALDLNCICMLKPEINAQVVRNNLLMHLYNGTELHYSFNNQARKKDTIDLWLDYVQSHSDIPYIIPTGGSSPRGTIGFVNAAFELKEQIEAGILPMPDYIYVACGSVATTTGLILGCKAAQLPIKIIAIAIEPEDPKDPLTPQIKKLFVQTNALLHKTDPSFPLYTLNDSDYEINREFTGADYGLYTLQGNGAKKIFYETEGLNLDGSYTAKAAAALLNDLKNDKCKNKKVLFWNTYCAYDFSDRIKDLDYKKLPECFHCYFEQDVQELDRITQP